MGRITAAVAGIAVAGALCAASPAAAGAAPSDTVWLCKPGLVSNPCKESNATTHIASDGTATTDDPPFATRPKIDCFYVYPTVSGQSGANADLTIDPEQIAIARYQAARFSEVCRVYAPMYRQLTLGAIFNPPDDPAAAAELAYSDVRAAWRDYLARFNRGRGFVLIGHSQGSGMLQALIRGQIDPRPRVRRRLISAVIPGGNVLVPSGADVGGTFDHVPACRTVRQLRCVLAWSTFGRPPPANARYGKSASRLATWLDLPQGDGLEVLCNNPATPGGGAAALSTLARTEPFPGLIGVSLTVSYLGMAPTAPTPWVEPQDHFSGECVTSNGANVLMISPLGEARVPLPAPTPDWGLHLTDINIVLGDLVAVVGTEAARYVKKFVRR